MSGSGISWARCKSAPRSRQTPTPAPHHSVFYRPDALPAAQPTVSKHWKAKAQQSRNKRITPTGNRMLEGEPTGGQNDWGMSFCFHRSDDSISVSQCSEDASLETRDDIERCGLPAVWRHCPNRERECAHTIGTVLVPWAGHFQC